VGMAHGKKILPQEPARDGCIQEFRGLLQVGRHASDYGRPKNGILIVEASAHETKARSWHWAGDKRDRGYWLAAVVCRRGKAGGILCWFGRLLLPTGVECAAAKSRWWPLRRRQGHYAVPAFLLACDSRGELGRSVRWLPVRQRRSGPRRRESGEFFQLRAAR
jgi:hypothetical protein